MVTFTVDGPFKLTEAQKEEIKRAGQQPVTYDEDCPPLNDEMMEALRRARAAKPYKHAAS